MKCIFFQTSYQDLCGKIPEGRLCQSGWIPQLHLQQRLTQTLHATTETDNTPLIKAQPINNNNNAHKAISLRGNLK